MRSHSFTLLMLGTFLCLGGARACADLLVEDWDLVSGVVDASSGERDFRSFETVMNPFNDSHIARVGISVSWASYAFAWSESDNIGSFLIEASHQAEDVDSALLVSLSTGHIHLAASEALTLTLEARYSYYLPPNMMGVQLHVDVFDHDEDDEILFHSLQRDDSFGGNPASGTLAIDGQITLPAGHLISLEYEIDIISFAGGTGLLGTGSGYVSFEVEPVPEPASACVLSLGSLMLLCRRRRETRHRTASRKGLQCDPTAPRF